MERYFTGAEDVSTPNAQSLSSVYTSAGQFQQTLGNNASRAEKTGSLLRPELELSYRKFINIFSPFMLNAEPDEISRKKRRYRFDKNDQCVVYFLQEGDYFLSTQNGHKIIDILSSPSIAGVVPGLSKMPLYLERVDYGKISYLPHDDFWRLVFEFDLFDDAMLIMSAQQSELINYIALNKANALEEVRSLIGWWSKIPDHLKRRFSIMYLIENSSWLSKSSISRALKAMKEKGEIALERGRIS
ncbi:transcriptional regulator [Erwinia sp. 9145]|uniref:transcriptional regulator n=1 Tax=Erwinia sp. 9145 TaxID=1500895 RepID=UPI001E2F9A9E|nr:transcriptional regulator [Erwinia sp. 9145]